MTFAEHGLNPFVVPGYEQYPDRALCPWLERNRGHISHYCKEVGNMGVAFEQFCTSIGDCSGIRDDGQIVVVTGPERSGKTSLINLCVHWLQKTVQETNCIIVDATRARREGMTIDERFKYVQTLLSSRLRREQLDHWLQEDLRASDDRDAFFVLLSDHVHQGYYQAKKIFVILWPSLESDVAEEEINMYASGVVRPGLVFFFEYSTARPVPRYHQIPPPIQLELNHLKQGEANILVQSRLEAPAVLGRCPTVAPDHVIKYENLKSTQGVKLVSGPLLSLFRRVYATRLAGESRQATLDSISYHEILEAALYPEASDEETQRS